MGRLIKNHLARLIVLTAAAYQLAAGVHGIFWPKIFWDFSTHALDPIVKPVPALQILNILFGIIGLCWEWPLFLLAGTPMHRWISARLAFYPISALVAVLQYQGTNAAIYYLAGIAVYFWAYSEGEIVYMPWKVTPEKPASNGSRV